jgi:ABC-type polysaccharide/polyol phosphate transport system ATPase subunit
MNVIEVNGVSKIFRRNLGRKLLRDQVLDVFRPRQQEEIFHALKNVSFKVEEGEAVALIGENGAGKSTMLSLVTGLAEPDTGTLTVNGRVAALLALGSGFHPDLTGEENVFMNAALLGFSERAVKERYSAIIEFSEIGDFIKEPLRTYSSGMMIRLAFSVAVHVDPAILIVDEVLGVGDAHFQEKCAEKVASLRRDGVTMLCVSHATTMVTDFCDRAIWLHHGELICDGQSGAVVKRYLDYVANPAAGVPSRDELIASADAGRPVLHA